MYILKTIIAITLLFFNLFCFAQKVYQVEYESQADLKIFYVDYESQAGWENKDKMHVLKFGKKE